MHLISNPVLPGFHPDPSIVCVGDTFYLANSTFEWYPGVELHSSRDLANWQPLPSPLSKKALLDMTGNPASSGIWAPCLSYDKGLFYLVYTNVRTWASGPWKDTPNFLVTSPSIEGGGPWSEPVFLNASGFDPSLFHDDDGRKWLVNMEWDYRKKDPPGPFSGILLQEYSPAKKRLVGKPRKIFTGTALKLVEGPHLYKRNGWYYLLVAEGGTQYGHAATVARSRTVEGPYEVHPANPLLTSYNWPRHPLQKAGHASWCETSGGRTYLAFLCGRPLPETRNCVLGRETGIAELEWRDDWPYLKYVPEARQKQKEDLWGASVPNYPPLAFESPVPLAAPPEPYSRAKCYRFEEGPIDPDFKTLRTPLDKAWYSFAARPGFLRLRGGQSPVSPFQQTLFARRQTDFSFNAETYMEFKPENFQEFAGLCWRYDEHNQYLLSVSHDEQKGRVLCVQTMIGGAYTRTEDTPVNSGAGVWLGLTVWERVGRFRYSQDGKTWVTLRPSLDAAVLSDEYFHEGFTGAFTGIFCVDTACYTAHADFAYFAYTPEIGNQGLKL
jgi:xylan 1,4-beta-xylosidase